MKKTLRTCVVWVPSSFVWAWIKCIKQTKSVQIILWHSIFKLSLLQVRNLVHCSDLRPWKVNHVHFQVLLLINELLGKHGPSGLLEVSASLGWPPLHFIPDFLLLCMQFIMSNQRAAWEQSKNLLIFLYWRGNTTMISLLTKRVITFSICNPCVVCLCFSPKSIDSEFSNW